MAKSFLFLLSFSLIFLSPFLFFLPQLPNSALCFLPFFPMCPRGTLPLLPCLLITPPAFSSSSLVLSCRNLSSADAGRQTMRNYSGLIDSLMAYVQNCVAASRCDDKVRVQAPGDAPISNPDISAHNCKAQVHTLARNSPGPDISLSENPRVRLTLSGCFCDLSQ